MTDALNTQEAAERIEQMMDAGNANPEPDQEPSDEHAQDIAETQDYELESIDAESDEDIEEVEEAVEEVSDDEDVWMPGTIDELAEALEVDVDALKAIRVNTKVDGVEGEATLADVIKGYQLDKSLTQRSEALANQRREFESQSQAQLQALHQRIQEVDHVSQILESQIEAEVGQIDWQQLRAEDPAEYAAKRQEFIERIGSVQQQKQMAIQQGIAQQEQIMQQQQVAHQQRLVQEHNALVDAIPEWRDQEAMQVGMGEIRHFLQSKGVSDQEIDTIWDHRTVLLARDAMRYEQMQKKAEPAKKQLKQKPKFVKPGARQGKEAANAKRNNNLKARLKKSGSLQDAAALLLNRM